jgi:hypothetical protein
VWLLADIGGQAQGATDLGAKTWIGRHGEFEEFLRTSPPAGPLQKIPVGVTSPMKVTLAKGGPIEAAAWKPIRPGWYPSGFYESYKAEVAAYEIDKLIGLDMVPPTVERRIDGEVGAAVMWVAGVTTFAELGQDVRAPREHAARWNWQLVRAMMFDNLIGNLDPNLGNWLKDAAWNLILIDHSRAFTASRELYHRMNQIDVQLWERMKALDEAQLATALSRWLGKSEIRAVLQRRDRMQQAIDKLVKERGESAVFIRRP